MSSRGKMENEQQLSELVDYLFGRLEAIKAENKQLIHDNNKLRRKVNLQQQQHTPTKVIAKENKGTSDIENQVLTASKEIAENLVKPAGNRNDLQLHKTGKKIIQKLNKDLNLEIQQLLLIAPNVVNMRDHKSGFTLLHFCSQYNSIKTLQLLLEEPYNMDPFVTDLFGRIPLHTAAEFLNYEACEILIQYMKTNPFGENAPQDIAGLTPAGFSALKNKKDPLRARKVTQLLHQVGDCCISPSPVVSHRRRKSRLFPNSSMKRQKNIADQSAVAVAAPLVENIINFGYNELPGYRVNMEDAMCFSTALSFKGEPMSLFSVFDGHGGSLAARFCAEHLLDVFHVHLELDLNLEEILKRTVLSLDEKMSELEEFQLKKIQITTAMGNEEAKYTMEALDNSGTTMVLVLVTSDKLFCANVGDSRAILIQKDNNFKPLSRDHKPYTIDKLNILLNELKEIDDDDYMFYESELDRIEINEGKVSEDGYVMIKLIDSNKEFKLGMTRTLGNFNANKEAIVNEPEIIVVERNVELDLCIVVACDGVWDVYNNSECSFYFTNALLSSSANVNSESVKSVSVNGKEEEKLSNICRDFLLDCLMERNSQDNMSIILVDLSLSNQHELKAKKLEEISKSKKKLSFQEFATPIPVSNSPVVNSNFDSTDENVVPNDLFAPSPSPGLELASANESLFGKPASAVESIAESLEVLEINETNSSELLSLENQELAVFENNSEEEEQEEGDEMEI